MDAAQVFAMLGFPFRIAGRIPLTLRYIWGMKSNFFAAKGYTLHRFGSSSRFKPWLLLDAEGLESLEHLINEGTDEEILNFRAAHVTTWSTISVVGSLLASAAATMLTLGSLSDILLLVRAMFTLSLTLSLLSVFFTLLQQHELSMITNAHMLRVFLWNGKTRAARSRKVDHSTTSPTSQARQVVRESSLTALYILTAPFELLVISVCNFLGATVMYLGLAARANLDLGTGPRWRNRAVLAAFIVCTLFPLMMFGQSLGQKDRETAKCKAVEQEMNNGMLAHTTNNPPTAASAVPQCPSP